MPQRLLTCLSGLLMLCVAACARTPTQPVTAEKNTGLELPPVTCAAQGADLRCRATYGNADITTLATWSVSSANPDDPNDVPAIIVSPGLITPVHQGVIRVGAKYTLGINAGTALSTHTYAVAPGAPPSPLAYLSGFISEMDGKTAISGALVEITEGDRNAGRTSTTSASGTYSFANLAVDRPFTLRVSRTGYVTMTEGHPAITDDPFGVPQSTSHHFKLARTSSDR